jgi:hypothetical protein
MQHRVYTGKTKYVGLGGGGEGRRKNYEIDIEICKKYKIEADMPIFSSHSTLPVASEAGNQPVTGLGTIRELTFLAPRRKRMEGESRWLKSKR